MGLWVQNGKDPVLDSVRMPETQAEADESAWTKGACFVSMGRYMYLLSAELLLFT